MTRTVNLLPFDSPKAGSIENHSFNVLIGYEDAETGNLAKKTYDFLEQNLGKECLFSNTLWKFGVLSIPGLREMAAKDAAKADIIMFACNTHELSPDVKGWIELWVAESHCAFAVVVLFGSSCKSPEARTGIRNYLSSVAKRGGMEFFAQRDRVGSEVEERFGFQRQKEPSPQGLSLPGGANGRETGLTHWGINE